MMSSRLVLGARDVGRVEVAEVDRHEPSEESARGLGVFGRGQQLVPVGAVADAVI